MRWLHHKRFWWLVLGGLLLAGLFRLLPINSWLAMVREWLIGLGLWATPGFVLVYLVATLLGLPNILLMLFAGTLFSLPKAVVLVSIADTLGAIACFGLGRSLARQRIKKWLKRHPSFARLDQAVAQKGWKIVLLTRLSPLVPSNVLNYGFSCTKVNFGQYCFFSWLGMLPVISLYVYLGTFSRSLMGDGLSPSNLILQIAGVGVAIGAAIYTTRVARHAMTVNEAECEPLTRDN